MKLSSFYSFLVFDSLLCHFWNPLCLAHFNNPPVLSSAPQEGNHLIETSRLAQETSQLAQETIALVSALQCPSVCVLFVAMRPKSFVKSIFLLCPC